MNYKILLVDDEEKILFSLRRLFMEDGYEIFLARSGNAAVEILKKEHIDVIVSDQKMPEMSGVEFLEQTKEYSPDSIRILLTGYADIGATIDSINKCGVFKYIAKPWNNDELKNTIRYAFELKKLRDENHLLQKLTEKQNIELKDLNANLEKKVNEQTENIRNMLDESRTLCKRLDRSFINSIRVFINMIKLRNETISIHLKNTARMSKSIAQRMKLAESEIKDIEIAALLHDIGKMGIKDAILNKAFGEMTTSEKSEYMKHPILGQAALESIENMEGIGIIVRHHHEEWNGRGFPDRLNGEKIPVASRIIAVATDYDELLSGALLPVKFTQSEAKDFIIKNSKQRYDPEVAVIFVSILASQPIDGKGRPEIKVLSSELEDGMVLARDLFTTSGFLLLNEGTNMTKRHVNNIIDFEKAEKKKYEIFVVSK